MPRWTAPLALALLVPAATWAQGPLSAELCRAVARAWSLPASEVEALAVRSETNLPDLAVTAMMAKSAGKPIAEAWALHVAQPTWAEAFVQAGLNPAEVVQGVEGRLSAQTWAALQGRTEPVALAALLRTMERFTGRAPEPLARELARKPFVEYFPELAGVKTGSSPQGPPASGPDKVESLGLVPEDPRGKLVMPYPGYAPALSGSKPPPSTVATTPK